MAILAAQFGDPVWLFALSPYHIFTSLTPSAFMDKMAHVPMSERGKIAVIANDVLRATTTIHAGIAAGSTGVCFSVKPKTGGYDLTPPFGSPDEWLYGGEENGLAIAGGAIGNSPLDVDDAGLNGKYLRFFSTNGARAMAAIHESQVGRVFLTSFANIEKTALKAIRDGYTIIWFVCGGFYGSATIEDTVCAGRGIHALLDQRCISLVDLDDESRVALSAAEPYFGDNQRLVRDMQQSQVGHLLCQIGRDADIYAVVGQGFSTDLWERMSKTVVACTLTSGVPLFVTDEEAA
jgi:phosphosulfolactate phosphohydrolase-like enzyme